MKFDSAVSLKKSLVKADLWKGIGMPIASAAFHGERAFVASAAASRPRPQPAIGIQGKGGKYQIAVRIESAMPGIASVIEFISKKAKREVVVKTTGRIYPQKPWYQKKNRPLQIGGSIGHFQITAGTLGCFVERNGEEYVLSNNHVLADENRGKKGDAILQPGDLDGGKNPQDIVGHLDKFIKLKTNNNVVDCATASLVEGISYYYNWIEGKREIQGVRTSMLDEGETVFKLGRTTGLTEGRIAAIELDALGVHYDMGLITFDSQFEIEPVGSTPFSNGGDSGSLILDRHMNAIGLLFAGNGIDATYANGIGNVLSALDAKLVF